MRSIATLLLCTSISLGAAAQTTLTNGGFENWGNASPGVAGEPTNWYSNKSGSAIAKLANATCFQETSAPHSGTYCVRLETIMYLGISVVNGSLTTGVVNAPSTNKTEGYIGTVNYSSSSDIRHMAFTGRPDSLVGWYKYTPGGASEQGKVRVILHTGDYYDPETPTTNHPDPTANKIADATWLSPFTTVSTWTRFSVPLNYVSAGSPTYVMINATPSADQNTSVAGSKIWFDDLEVVYTPTTTTCATPSGLAASSITATTAHISWTAPGSVLGAEYVIDGSASDPAAGAATTTVTTSSFTASTLSPNTTYYVHLRDSCGATSLSPWTMTMFTTDHAVGVASVNNDNFHLSSFPNPVTNDVTVSISGANGTTGNVQLMDISGRVISAISVTAPTVTVSMSGLAAGLYLIRYSDAVRTQTIKITKQ